MQATYVHAPPKHARPGQKLPARALREAGGVGRDEVLTLRLVLVSGLYRATVLNFVGRILDCQAKRPRSLHRTRFLGDCRIMSNFAVSDQGTKSGTAAY